MFFRCARYIAKKRYYFIGASVVLFLFLRLYCLDQDLPPFGVGEYQPIDEGCYAQLALNYINYGDINPNHVLPDELQVFIGEQMIMNVVGNLGVLIGLLTLGDNYYGLRVPYVFFSLCSFALIAVNLYQLRRLYGRRTFLEMALLGGILLYLAIDFTMTLSGRVVEPSGVRLLCVQALIFLMLSIQNIKLRYFFLGLLSVLSVFLVYITNFFVCLALLFLLLLEIYWYSWKSSRVNVFSALLGGVLAFGVGEWYYHSFWDVGAIANALSSVVGFTQSSSDSGSYSLGGWFIIFKHIVSFCGAHSNIYSISVFAIFLFYVLDVIWRSWKTKDEKMIYILLLFGMFFLQTLASDDYIVRKYVLIYPIIWLVLYYRFLVRGKLRQYTTFFSWKERNRRRIFALILAICLGAVAFRLFVVRDSTRADIDCFTRDLLLIPVFLLVGYFIYLLDAPHTRTNRRHIIMISSMLALSVFVNLTLLGRYVIWNPTFSDRDIMIDLQQYDHQYILGEYEHVYSLYNHILPIQNTNDYYATLINQNHEFLFCAYGEDYDGGLRYYFDNVLFTDSEYTVVPVHIYEREYQCFGHKKPLAIYRFIPKDEVKKYYHELSIYYQNVRDNLQKQYIAEYQRLYLKDKNKAKKWLQIDYLKNADLHEWEKEAIRRGSYRYYELKDEDPLGVFYRDMQNEQLKEIDQKRQNIREASLF